MRSFIIILFSISNYVCCSQDIEFKAQLLCNNVTVKNYTITINGKPYTTDDFGILKAPVSAASSQVTILIPDKKYIIIYPTGGTVLIPKDNSLPQQIILGNVISNDYLKEYVALSKKLDNSSDKTAVELKQLQSRFDSLSSLLLKLNYSNADLASARYRQDGIDSYLLLITGSLNDYIVRAMNFSTTFKNNAEMSTRTKSALDELKTQVGKYNDNLEMVNRTNADYEKKIFSYWQDRSLSNAYRAIVDSILSINTVYIWPLNEVKNRINTYYFGEVTGSKEEYKKNIQTDINSKLPALDKKLYFLKKDIDDFVAKLKDY